MLFRSQFRTQRIGAGVSFGQHHAAAAHQAQMAFELARFVKQVDVGLAVAAQRDGYARAHQRVGWHHAVTQIALGRRAGTDRSSRRTQQLHFIFRQVNGVHCRGAWVEQTVVRQQFNGALVVFCQARFNFFRLFGDVQVHHGVVFHRS